MNKKVITFYLTAMILILVLVLSFMSKDVVACKLFASFGIIAGAFTSKYLSKV